MFIPIGICLFSLIVKGQSGECILICLISRGVQPIHTILNQCSLGKNKQAIQEKLGMDAEGLSLAVLGKVTLSNTVEKIHGRGITLHVRTHFHVFSYRSAEPPGWVEKSTV